MRQTQLLQIAMRLKPGEAIQISASDMLRAAEGSLSSLIFDSVRHRDVENFAKQIEENWGVEMTLNPVTGNYTMCKVNS